VIGAVVVVVEVVVVGIIVVVLVEVVVVDVLYTCSFGVCILLDSLDIDKNAQICQ